ncbi:MAG TPA: CBS domain-containing protein [Limnobacter sp.]|uniref:CBS domain-containing protein n=1 Tax=Limnobacter sp. TaxID=2003368 RepID=UPI002ED920B6
MIRQHYQPLEHITAGATDVITVSDPSRPIKLTADSPAFDAMTDLRRIQPVSIDPAESLEQARTTMIVCGVKLLFVRNTQGNLLGLITANDLAGERAIVQAANSGRSVLELTVNDVMVKLPDLEFLEFGAVSRAEVGHIIATLKAHNRQHALVVDNRQGNLRVVGLFSATQIARQMGIPVFDPVKANTFAEIEAAVAAA